MDGFNEFGTVVLYYSLISENSKSRFMLELMLLLCLFEFWYAVFDLWASFRFDGGSNFQQ